MSDELDLDAIEAGANAATPSPWGIDTAKNCEHDRENPDLVIRRDGGPSLSNKTYGNNVARFYPGDADGDKYSGQDTADARFVAHARTDVPKLVAEVRRRGRLLKMVTDNLQTKAAEVDRLKAENERLKAENEDLQSLIRRLLAIAASFKSLLLP